MKEGTMRLIKQLFFRFITQPIAKILDLVNIPKYKELKARRKRIAEMNKNEYIRITSGIMFETELIDNLNQGVMITPSVIPLLIEKNILRATEMFYEKKQLGYFDELNLMIK